MTEYIDPLEVSPDNNKVLLENDKVRVLEVTIAPGEKVPMHSHPAVVAYVLSGSKDRWTFPDGSTKDNDMKNGLVVFSEAFSHSAENIGETEEKLLVIELKK